VQTLNGENSSLQAQIAALKAADAEWREREAVILEELKEAKLNSSSSVKVGMPHA
jgi:hypothetical protein